MTAEPTVQAESTSAISVTAVSSEVALQEQTVASSEQTSSSQDKTSEGLSEKPVTVNETREASASDLVIKNNTSSASSDNFGLKVTNLSRPIPSDVKVSSRQELKLMFKILMWKWNFQMEIASTRLAR